MQLNVNGAQAIEVSERTFGGEFNETLVHQAVVAYMAGGRQGTRAQKTRSEVAGGGKKPWRQKGTGRARAGSMRWPDLAWRWRDLRCQAAGSLPEAEQEDVPRCSALHPSELVRLDRLVVVEDFAVEAPKTKALLGKLNGMGLSDVLIVTEAR